MRRRWILLCCLLVVAGCKKHREEASAVPEQALIPTTAPEEFGPRSADVQYISVDFAKAFSERGGALFIDVRGDHVFDMEHIRGAVSMPLQDILNGRLPDVPKDTLIIAYCGCPHSMSSAAAEYLQKRGFTNVYVLDEGFYEWKERGYPVEGRADADQQLQRMSIVGQAPGLAPGTPVYASEPRTGQLEASEIRDDGTYEMHLPFYGLAAGVTIEVSAGDRSAVVPFAPGVTVQVTLGPPAVPTAKSGKSR
ncbi:MAG: rhodanese-like domain-containing protein [Candidatus Dadabacteria bacterium]|nr:MAG: rhodanese-like domain-containing protein [Candidatus Dadabacteria bacterium]